MSFLSVQFVWLECHLVAGQQGSHAFGVVFFSLAFRALAFFVVLSGFGVSGNHTFEVTENDLMRTL